MYITHICPPSGPWPMPPWCSVKILDLKWIDSVESNNSKLKGKLGIEMLDTWGRNYNFSMVENTRDNIESSFSRLEKIGAKEVVVNDFYRAVYADKQYDLNDTNYKIDREVFLNDFRDESMTDEDLSLLSKTAKKHGLKIIWRTSFHFWDIGKYIKIGVNINDEVKKDFASFNQPKNKEWVIDFLDKYQKLMVDRAKKLNEYGFDSMILTPGYMTPNFQPHEDIANEKWKEIYKEVKKEFKGNVGYLVSDYAFVEGVNDIKWQNNNNYWRDMDEVWLAFYELPNKYKNTNGAFDKYLIDLKNGINQNDKNISLIFRVNSYDNSINNGLVELLDINNPVVKALNANQQYQSEYVTKFFNWAKDNEKINKIFVTGYWWDDKMDPEVKVPISKSGSIRNKDAEKEFLRWAK